jgi:pimeloyl-ACP methyl ester carboxylesterase
MSRSPPFGRLIREAISIPAVIASPWLPSAKIERIANGEPVLVIPGFLSDDNPTSVLRRSFDSAGFMAFGWGQGWNTGIAHDLVERLAARLREVSAASGGQKVVLVGWSLGGLYARELAHVLPTLSRMVVTLGSPFSGDLRSNNNAWRIYELINSHRVDQLPLAVHFQTKPPVPTVAIWSSIDGVVSPEASRGSSNQSDEQIELRATHLGLASTRSAAERIVRIVAERL